VWKSAESELLATPDKSWDKLRGIKSVSSHISSQQISQPEKKLKRYFKINTSQSSCFQMNVYICKHDYEVNCIRAVCFTTYFQIQLQTIIIA
jgi:hypothetical protein